MPTAKKLPSGSWRIQVYDHTEEIPLSDGTLKKKRIYKSFTSDVPDPKGKRIAEKMAAEWASEKENAHKVFDITIGEAIDRYIDYPDFVAEKFSGRCGRLVNLNPNMITSRFASALRQAGLPHFRFHDLRHPYVKPTTKKI